MATFDQAEHELKAAEEVLRLFMVNGALFRSWKPLDKRGSVNNEAHRVLEPLRSTRAQLDAIASGVIEGATVSSVHQHFADWLRHHRKGFEDALASVDDFFARGGKYDLCVGLFFALRLVILI